MSQCPDGEAVQSSHFEMITMKRRLFVHLINPEQDSLYVTPFFLLTDLQENLVSSPTTMHSALNMMPLIIYLNVDLHKKNKQLYF